MSKTRADERSVSSGTYSLEAIRGNQAGREFYVAMCTFKQISKIFTFNDENEVPAEMRAQRILRDTRIPALKNYIINNPKDYTLSSLTASVDGAMEIGRAHV